MLALVRTALVVLVVLAGLVFGVWLIGRALDGWARYEGWPGAYPDE